MDGAKAAGENVPDKLMKAAQKIVDTPKVRIAGQPGKEAAKDIPSFARGEVPTVGETSADFARRILLKNGRPIEEGAGKEFSKIKKWADRAFEDPPDL